MEGKPGVEESTKKSKSLINWKLYFAYILTLICLGDTIVNIIGHKHTDYVYPLILTILCYFLYLILAFGKSEIYLMVKDVKSEEDIIQEIIHLYKTMPYVKVKAEAYHYHRYYRNGRRRGREKVTTYKEKGYLPIYSSLDLSGPFKISYSETKGYIRLNLNRRIIFADEISVADFIALKEKVIDSVKGKDDYYTHKVKKDIEDAFDHRLIKTTGGCSCFLNTFFYSIFYILLLPFVFDIILLCSTSSQSYTLTKIFSTRYDLSQSQYFQDQKYQNLTPSITIGEQSQPLEKKQSIHLSTEPRGYDLPTEEELIAAHQFSKYVPVFEVGENGTFNVYVDEGLDQPFSSEDINNSQPQADQVMQENKENKDTLETKLIPEEQNQFKA
ncbi:MAG: hypothetical protein MJ252_31160 [archaeon]|nr:hypothetical protein [archaeon]